METKDKLDSSTHVCSRCGRVFKRIESRHMPFCSKRCQQIDLAGWLDERHGLPVEDESLDTNDS